MKEKACPLSTNSSAASRSYTFMDRLNMRLWWRCGGGCGCGGGRCGGGGWFLLQMMEVVLEGNNTQCRQIGYNSNMRDMVA